MEGDQIVISGDHGTLNSFTVAAMQAASSQVRKVGCFFRNFGVWRYEMRERERELQVSQLCN